MTKYQEENEREFIVKKPWSRKIIISCMITSTCFVLGLWYYYEYHYLPFKEIPLLTAEDGPTKIKPEKVDGALVPHMDKIVYDTLKPGHDMTRLVSMMPEPEQPINVTPVDSKDAIEDIIGKVLSSDDAAPSPTDPAAEVIKPESLEQFTDEKALTESVKTLKVIPVENSNARTLQKAQKAQPSYKLQLVSVRTRDIAEKEWERLKKLHLKLLGNLPYTIQKVDVINRGIFYRLLAGKFPSSSNAKTVCKKLKSAQQPCITIKD